MIDVIVRRVRERKGGDGYSPAQAEALVREVSEEYRHHVLGQQVGSAITYEKKVASGKDNAQVSKECSQRFEKSWDDIDERMKIIPGKLFISALSSRLQADFGCSITINMLIDELRVSELDKTLMENLETLEKFCTDN